MFPVAFFYKNVTESTMEDARNAVRSGSGHGTVCAAMRQNNGKCRVPGRRWVDDGAGALLFTLVLHRDSVQSPYPLTQLLALALCRRLENGFGLTPRIKWPNDVLVAGGKIAGILVELEGDFFLAGIGVNILQKRFPSDLRYPAISLTQAFSRDENGSGTRLSPSGELPELLTEIESLLVNSPNVEEVEHRLAGLGAAVTVRLGNPSRNDLLTGTISGLQKDGALLIDLGGGEIRSIYSGEIEEIRFAAN